MNLHTNPMENSLFDQIKKEALDVFSRNELSLFTLDTFGIVLMRATFAYHPELNELPVMSEEELGSEIATCIVDKSFNSKLILEKSGLERLLNNIARACCMISKPVMQGTMKVSVAFGNFNNELKISLIWVQ